MVASLPDLTLPAAGSSSARRLLNLYLKRVTQDLLRIPLGRFRSQVFDDFADIRAIVERLIRDKKAGAAFSMLRRPTHSTLVRCLHAELWGDGDVTKLDGWLSELTALMALELAAMGELPADGIVLRESPRRLSSIGGRFELRLDSRYRLGLKPHRLVLIGDGRQLEIGFEDLAGGDGPWPDGVTVRRPYTELAPGLLLATVDNNPLRMLEAHPDKLGNAIDLGGQPLERWQQSLRAALGLVDEHLPELGQEIQLLMQLLIPVGYDPEKHLSASYAEAIGTAYLTLHPDPMTMAEALIHEFSHNKLNLLWTLDEVLKNAFEPLFSSPVRPDPRPLHGVMLAVHAFVPVARLYERLREEDHPLSKESGFDARFAQIVRGNHAGIETLAKNADATPAGQAVIDELVRWDEHFQSQLEAR